jgi:biopolymer transport protein ExbB/TolQ
MGAASDLSPIGLVVHADIIVQGVVFGLVLCSVACWAIIFEKVVQLRGLRRAVARIETVARNPGEEGTHRGRAARVIAAARAEFLDGHAGGESAAGLRGRLEEAMRLAYIADLRRLEVGLPFLATLGSAAPFIGLFGTVWGIMRGFTVPISFKAR